MTGMSPTGVSPTGCGAGVEVRGNATADELAAVLATLAEIAVRALAPSRYERWRQERIVALRHTGAP